MRNGISDGDWSNSSCPYGDVLRDEDIGRPLVCVAHIMERRVISIIHGKNPLDSCPSTHYCTADKDSDIPGKCCPVSHKDSV